MQVGSAVTLIDSMGTDLSIVNAARVSFGANDKPWNDIKDTKLIRYLAKHDHWSPFAHAILKFHIKAPIFIARQLAKHQVGFSWNEISRRYVSTEPEVWSPVGWREKGDNIKQGSSSNIISFSKTLTDIYLAAATSSIMTYNNLLDAGVCPEQARAVLPQGMMTEWIWTGSLYGFYRVCNLRRETTAQEETKEIAKLISSCCLEKFPVCWNALNEH